MHTHFPRLSASSFVPEIVPQKKPKKLLIKELQTIELKSINPYLCHLKIATNRGYKIFERNLPVLVRINAVDTPV